MEAEGFSVGVDASDPYGDGEVDVGEGAGAEVMGVVDAHGSLRQRAIAEKDTGPLVAERLRRMGRGPLPR